MNNLYNILPRPRLPDCFAMDSALTRYIDNLIRDHKKINYDGYYLDIHSLDEDDLTEFAAHLIKHDAVIKNSWDFLLEDASKDEIAYLLSAVILEVGHQKNIARLCFIERLEKSAITYYYDHMQGLINERINDVYQEDQDEAKINASEDDWRFEDRISI